MRGARLQRLAILHHSFDSIGIDGTSEAFVGTLHTNYYRHSHVFFSELSIKIDHLNRALLAFFGCSMCAMSFLPKKFGCAQKHTGAHFPTHDIGPLIDKQGKISVAMDPVLIGVPDNCL